MSGVFTWQCRACDSHCRTEYRTHALEFGEKHRCNGWLPEQAVTLAPVLRVGHGRRRLIAGERRKITT